MAMLTPLNQRPLYLEVAERVRELIYQRKLLPGDWIDELELAVTLGISRTPLREALKVLHSESLVELVPRRGCRVVELDETGLLELFPVMAELESLCAELATKKMTASDLSYLQKLHSRLENFAAKGNIDGYYEVNRQFHIAVQELASNRWLEKTSMELRNVLMLARHRQLTKEGRLLESLNEHRAIMKAFEEKDSQAAAKAMYEHLCSQEKVQSMFTNTKS